MRKDCCHLIQTLKGISGIEKVTLTTNGVLLEPVLEELKSGGIDGINISLDTLDRKTYETITGKDCLNQVLSAVEAAVKLKIPVKLNAVSLDLGKDHWTELTELARRLPVDVRLIELMPIGHGKDFLSMDHRLLFAELKKQYPGMEEDRPVPWFGTSRLLPDSGLCGNRRIHQRRTRKVLRKLQPGTADLSGLFQTMSLLRGRRGSAPDSQSRMFRAGKRTFPLA